MINHHDVYLIFYVKINLEVMSVKKEQKNRIWTPEQKAEIACNHLCLDNAVMDGVHQKLDQLLCEQLADFCLFSYPPDGECQWIPLKRDRMVAVLASGHPMAKLSSFPIASFRDEPFIMPADGYDYDSMKVLKRHGINPSISYSTGEDHAAIAMIAAGLGIGLFNELATSGRTANTVLLPLDPPEYAELGVAYPASRILSPAAKRFIKYLKVYVSEA